MDIHEIVYVTTVAAITAYYYLTEDDEDAIMSESKLFTLIAILYLFIGMVMLGVNTQLNRSC